MLKGYYCDVDGGLPGCRSGGRYWSVEGGFQGMLKGM